MAHKLKLKHASLWIIVNTSNFDTPGTLTRDALRSSYKIYPAIIVDKTASCLYATYRDKTGRHIIKFQRKNQEVLRACCVQSRQPNSRLYWLTNDQHYVDQLITAYIDKRQQHLQRKD